MKYVVTLLMKHVTSNGKSCQVIGQNSPPTGSLIKMDISWSINIFVRLLIESIKGSLSNDDQQITSTGVACANLDPNLRMNQCVGAHRAFAMPN